MTAVTRLSALSAAASTADNLVGREAQLELLRRLRRSLPARSALLEGPAGVGKSALARATLEEAARDGWATLRIRGSAVFEGFPLAPWLTALHLPCAGGTADLAASVERRLAEMRSPHGLLVYADELRELDEPSMALLQRLVTAGTIVAVMAVASEAPLRRALVELTRRGLAERVRLEDLSLDEAGALASAMLGESVQDSSAYRIWQVTRGNPRYVREVVLSCIETGALRRVEGTWRLQGDWAGAARLREVVAASIGPLDPDERTAIDMLAFAGRLPFDALVTAVPERVIARLESRTIVTREGGALTISHPLHAEVLRCAVSPLRQRAIRERLVDVLTRAGAGGGGTAGARIASWSLAPEEGEPRPLDIGVRASLFPIGPAVASRLQDLLPGVQVAPGWCSDPLGRRDLDLAARLARSAYQQKPRVAEGAALADALVRTGRVAAAEAVVDEISGLAVGSDDRIRLAVARAKLLYRGRFEAEAAIEILLDALGPCDGSAQPALLAGAYETLADIELDSGRPAAALTHGRRSAALLETPLCETTASFVVARSLGHLGLCDEALALIDEAVPQALGRDGRGPLVAQLLLAKAAILAWAGRHDEARRLAEAVREVALSSGDLTSAATFGLLAGSIMLLEGRPRSAGRLLGDAAQLLADHDMDGIRPWALYALAISRAHSGDQDGGASALAEGRALQHAPRFFDSTRHLAEVAVHHRGRRAGAAAEAAREGAGAARAAGMVHDEAFLLDAWMRIKPTAEAAERLRELAVATDSGLVGALARHATALVAEDPDGLLAAGKALAALGSYGMAADAAAAAARIAGRRRRAHLAETATRAASTFSARCEIAPATNTFGLAARLTPRELDVVELAAARLPSKEIARRLDLSVRTVDNHIYRAFFKLGVTDRAGLARAVSETAGTGVSA